MLQAFEPWYGCEQSKKNTIQGTRRNIHASHRWLLEKKVEWRHNRALIPLNQFLDSCYIHPPRFSPWTRHHQDKKLQSRNYNHNPAFFGYTSREWGMSSQCATMWPKDALTPLRSMVIREWMGCKLNSRSEGVYWGVVSALFFFLSEGRHSTTLW